MFISGHIPRSYSSFRIPYSVFPPNTGLRYLQESLTTLPHGSITMPYRLVILRYVLVCLLVPLSLPAAGETPDVTELRTAVESLRQLDPRVLPTDADGQRPERLSQMVADDVRWRRDELNRRDLAAWRSIGNRDDWETLKAARLEALRRSLGQFPAPPRTSASRPLRFWMATVFKSTAWSSRAGRDCW